MDNAEKEFMAKFEAKRNQWVLDPILFCREALGIGLCECQNGDPCELDPIQQDIIIGFAKLCRLKLKLQKKIKLHEIEKEIAEKIGVSVKSGKGIGKTMLAAVIGIWFLVCFPFARVVIMGPSFQQVKTRLWAEIAKWLGHAEKVFGKECLINEILEVRAEKIYCKHVSKSELGNRWFMFIQTFPKNADIEQQKADIQGNHDQNMLFLIDESSAIPDHVFEAIDETLTDALNVVFNIFNPNRATGWAIETHKKMRDKWVCYHVNAENSGRVSKQHIKYMRDKWGIDSNKYRVGVLGLEPLSDKDALIPWEWIQDAKDLWLLIEPEPGDYLLHGYDIGGGGDPSICCKRKGIKLLEFKQNSSPDGHEVRMWAQALLFKDQPDYAMIDKNGLGHNVYGELNALKVFKIIGVNTALGTSDPRFDRLRDKLFWRVREAFESRDIAIPPDDDELEGELSILTYSDATGKIKVVSKQDKKFRKEMMSRLQYDSPNKADAFSITYWMEDFQLRRTMEAMRKKSGTGIKTPKSTLRRAWMAM